MVLRPAHILIVNDEPQTRALIREKFSELGIECHVTGSSRQALHLLDSQQFAVLVADMHMPEVSGLDLLTYVKWRAAGCKVILITGASSRDCLAQAIMLGAYDYVERPFDVPELAEIVLKALEETGAPRLPHRAAAAMELGSRVEQASLESIRALVRAVEAKDPYTRRHSEQVAHYAVHLAEVLDVPHEQVECIRTASLLHDIGKIGVPDHILTKPGKLTDAEFEYVRRHPALGAEIIGNITMFGTEARLIRHHHERWDGKGYPDCLTGDQTPFASRIMCVADCIDAMLMKRTYKAGYTAEQMLDELERCAGTQFDPTVAAAAVRWGRSNPDKLILPHGDSLPATVLAQEKQQMLG